MIKTALNDQLDLFFLKRLGQIVERSEPHRFDGRLAERIPSNIIRVSESGIHSRGDIARLQDSGFSVFLIGEYLMRSGKPREALQGLLA